MNKAALILRPGPGWKHLAGAVWEHSSGIRIHTSGRLLRDRAGRTASIHEFFEHRELLYKLVKINGGNKKRGLMAFAMNFLNTPKPGAAHGS